MAINCPGPICSPLLGANVTARTKCSAVSLFDTDNIDGKLNIIGVHIVETIPSKWSFCTQHIQARGRARCSSRLPIKHISNLPT